MTDYAEFRLRIEATPTPNLYLVASSGLGGGTSATFVLPFNETELENFVLKLGRSPRGMRKIESPETALARTFGGHLFKTVMAGAIGDAYRGAHEEARLQGVGLRVTLSLTAAPKLATIPWEFLFDDPDFLATSPETPIVRFLEVATSQRPLQISLPIRILVVICSPTNAEQLNSGLERASLEPALKPLADLNAVTIDWLEHATLSALNAKLRSESYHILHFIGHGGFDQAHGEGALLFEDESQQGVIVGADRIAGLLRSRDSIRLVVLNSCEGARSSIDDPFSGVAGSLIERGFPAVIGMQFEISDRAAIVFAKEFYTVLAEGDPVDKAVAEARLAMFAGQDDVEWGTPVLYMRVADGRLFEVANAVPISREDTRSPDGEAPAPGPEGPGVAVPDVPPPVVGPWDRFVAGISRWRGLLIGAAFVAVVIAVLLVPAKQGTLQVIPVTDRPGYVHVTGGGFTSGETVELATGPKQTQVPVNTDGGFETDFDVGVGTAGPITALGQVSGRRAEAAYSLPGATASNGASQSTSNGPPSAPPSAPPSSAPPSLATGSCLDPGIRERSIVFYSDVDADGNALDEIAVFCIDPETGRIAPVLTAADMHDHKDDTFATWSPDHKQIAFTRKEFDEINDRVEHDILIREEDGSVSVLATWEDDDYFPAWSRDGWIAFVRDEGDTSSIMRMKIGDQDAETMATGRDYRAPAWSPSGSTLAFFGIDKTDDFDLATITTPGAVPTWLTSGPNNDLNPAWSLDGRTIVFVMDDGLAGSSDNDLYLLDVESQRITKQLTGRTVATGKGVQDGNPVWSPDGSQIAFYRKTPTGYHIWVMNSDGTNQQDLMPNRPGVNLDPNWR